MKKTLLIFLLLIIASQTLACSSVSNEYSLEISIDNISGDKTTIVNNGDTTGHEILANLNNRIIPKSADDILNYFSSNGDDRIIIKGKVLSKRSYYHEQTFEGKSLPLAIFTITKVEITSVITKNTSDKKYETGDIIEVYEGYAFRENENAEVVFEQDLYSGYSGVLKSDTEYVFLLMNIKDKNYGSGNVNKYFSTELKDVWGIHDALPINSTETEINNYDEIYEYYKNSFEELSKTNDLVSFEIS